MSTPTQASVADDAEIVRRILAHIDAGTTDEGDAWREPVENYLDPIRFTTELEMLRSFPSVYLPSAAIPNAGDHAERVTFGVPLFAVRGRDGRARVFRNACRHRGMTLVEGPGLCPRLGVPLSRLDVPTRRLAVARPARRGLPRSRHVHPRTGRGRQPRSGRPHRHRPAAAAGDRFAAPERRCRDGGPGRRQSMARQAAAGRAAGTRETHCCAR